MHTHHQRISQVRRWNTELLLHFDLSHKLQLPVVIEFALNLRQFCKQLLQHLLAYRFFVETQHVVGVCILTVDNRPICQIQPVSQRVIELRSLIAEYIANSANVVALYDFIGPCSGLIWCIFIEWRFAALEHRGGDFLAGERFRCLSA